MSPRVSVIIPTYRHRNFVLDTLESVFAQSFSDYEVIVVDDGSPDDTASILEPFASSGRIRLVRQANQGQAAARNTGLREARGEYVAYLDDDDLWPKDRLARHVALLDGLPDAVLVYGPCLKLHDNRLLPGPDGPHPSGRMRDALLRQYCLTSPGQATIRMAAVRAIGGFDVTLWGVDDWDLYLRLSDKGEFFFSDEQALFYRVHQGNASQDALRHARSAWRAYRKHARWNVPLTLSLARSGACYFVPRLLEHAYLSRRRSRHSTAVASYALACTFKPSVLFEPANIKGLLASLMHLAPRNAALP